MNKSGASGPAGIAAWIGLAAYIVAYDYYACKHEKETMSTAFGRALDHKLARWPTLLVLVIVVKHLTAPDVLSNIDPINKIAKVWRNELNSHSYNSDMEININFPRAVP